MIAFYENKYYKYEYSFIHKYDGYIAADSTKTVPSYIDRFYSMYI